MRRMRENYSIGTPAWSIVTKDKSTRVTIANIDHAAKTS